MISDLRGRFLRDLRISVTDNCNFRCRYCMPPEIFPNSFLPKTDYLGFDEIVRFATAAVALGAGKVKLTGGEPLLRPWLPDLIRQLHNIAGIEDIGLITNGYHFASHAAALQAAGLKRVTISLDSLCEETFANITGRGMALDKVLNAIDLAWEMEFRPLKINMVVQRGINDHEVSEFVSRFQRPGMELRFIEFMDVGCQMKFDPSLVVPNSEIHERLRKDWEFIPMLPAYPGEVSRRYRHADGRGEIGYISSMTQPFCSGCTRLRLTADGQLFTCLFSSRGVNIRTILETGSGEEIQEAICSVWGKRDDNYSEQRSYSSHREEKPEMYRIGG